MLQKLEKALAGWAALHTHMQADFTSTSALPFASFSKRVSHENGLIFMQDIYFHTNSFAQTRFATEARVHLRLGYSSMSCSGSPLI